MNQKNLSLFYLLQNVFFYKSKIWISLISEIILRVLILFILISAGLKYNSLSQKTLINSQKDVVVTNYLRYITTFIYYTCKVLDKAEH